jgi:hypothetical protein
MTNVRQGQAHVLCIAGLVLLLTGCKGETELGAGEGAGVDGSTPGIPQAERAAEEESVYRALLDSRYQAPEYVLGANTAISILSDSDIDALVTHLGSVLERASPETLADFRACNGAAYPLPSNMNLGSPYVLLTDAERTAILSPATGGWATFHERYPNAFGYLELSRVGFNAALDQAIVYVGFSFANLGGEGICYLMQKSGSTWLVADETSIWVS